MSVSGTAKNRPKAEFDISTWSEAEQWWANSEDSGRFTDLWKNGTLSMAPSEYVPTVEELEKWEDTINFKVGETRTFGEGENSAEITFENFDQYLAEARGRLQSEYNWEEGSQRFIDEVEAPRIAHEELVTNYLATGDPLTDPTPDTELTGEDQLLMLQRSGAQIQEERTAAAEATLAAQEEAEATLAAETEATRIKESQAELQDLWGIRTTAETEAEKFTDDYFLGEIQNASLRGAQIDISEQSQFDLISEKFTELWSPEAQARLGELSEEFGAPGEVKYARTDDTANLERLKGGLSSNRGTAVTSSIQQALSNSTILQGGSLLRYFTEEDDLRGLLG